MKYISIIIILSLSRYVTGYKKYRLSTTTEPSFYSIRIHPDIDKEVFSGNVSIYIKVSNSVESIEFHSSHLDITRLHLNSKAVEYNSDEFNALTSSMSYRFVEHELIQIKPLNNSLIPPGNYIIYIEYQGKFSTSTVGLFKTGYTKDDHKLSHLIATDFEPTYARTAFPCFDEPRFKARFQLSLVVPNTTYTAISNMKPTNIFNTSQGVVYKFQTTKRMSPYLLAFVISRYTHSSYRTERGVPIKIHSVNASIANNTEIMNFTEKLLNFFVGYTCYDYPLSKIDMVEFDRYESVATENWGLVTLRTGLLSPENDIYDLGQIYDVLAHEIAHFWFGNLVTNEWWDDIWLQEGFAVFMSLKVQDKILKNNAWEDFSFQYVEEIYWLELNKSSTPIINFQVIPKLIKANFNSITYNKGAALLRMIESALGSYKFQSAVISYINRYAFKTASTNDFLKILEDTDPNVDIRGFVESYLYENDLPIIHVSEQRNSYNLTQTGCRRNTDSSSRHKWTVPLTYTTNLINGKEKLIWFDKDMENLIISKHGEEWIKFNYRQNGLYRVNYSDSLWEKFMIHNKELQPSERDYLLLEAVGLYEAQIRSCDVALRYLKALSEVTDTLKLNVAYTFVAYEKLRKIQDYDQTAADILKNYFDKQLMKAGRQAIPEQLSARSVRNQGQDVPKSEVINNCIKYIKENLSQVRDNKVQNTDPH